MEKVKAERWNYTGGGSKPAPTPKPEHVETPEERAIPRSALWESVRALEALLRTSSGRLDSERFLLAQEEGRRVIALVRGRRPA